MLSLSKKYPIHSDTITSTWVRKAEREGREDRERERERERERDGEVGGEWGGVVEQIEVENVLEFEDQAPLALFGERQPASAERNPSAPSSQQIKRHLKMIHTNQHQPTFSGSSMDSALPWMTSITSLKPLFSTSVRACLAMSVYSTAYTSKEGRKDGRKEGRKPRVADDNEDSEVGGCCAPAPFHAPLQSGTRDKVVGTAWVWVRQYYKPRPF